MSINAWSELGTPQHPLSDERTRRIRQGTRLGKAAVEVFSSQPDAVVLSNAIHKVSAVIPDLSLDGLSGLCLGVRAGRLDLDISKRNSEGYRIGDNHEVGQIEFARSAGTYAAQLAELYEGKDFMPVFQDALVLAENGNSTLYQAADFLGYTFGMHDMSVEGVRL
jgi:hypothetical protein